MEKSGDVILHRRRGKLVGVRLSDAAEARARALAGCPSILGSLAVMKLLTGPGWISETAVDGLEYGTVESSRTLAVLEAELLSALMRSWVESNSDMAGRVAYRLTDEGRAALAGDPPEVPDLVESDPDARRLYVETIYAELERLGSATPAEPREIGFIPLPVSWPAAAE